MAGKRMIRAAVIIAAILCVAACQRDEAARSGTPIAVESTDEMQLPPSPSATPEPVLPTPTALSIVVEQAGPAVLWRAGGIKSEETSLFTVLGGADANAERVCVADAYNGAYCYDSTGEPTRQVSAGEVGYVVDVKFDAQGNIYVADGALDLVTAFNPEGEFLLAFGGVMESDPDHGRDSLRALAIGEEEAYVLKTIVNSEGVTEMRVQIFGLDGVLWRSFALDAKDEVRGMDVGPDGTLFLVSTAGFIEERDTEEGRLLRTIGGDTLGMAYPQMIAIDSAGNFYVTTQIPAAVTVLDPQGALIEWLGTETVRTDEGWPEGEFLFPVGVAVSEDGKAIYVGDSYMDFAYLTAFERP